ncbi:hypothetical protein TBLA_0B08370 [Henningerozyma blattae CBS 6284]|uniref:Uncharacterized protein n=1 Tax=Henningerozyma blattae (strain ATCC 34711 / CBS 6284 / DSM 70876 / NBRC 10599 / NRRL Y-10934 / UCD 77-7) TaxID=1071380 RepID=I2GZV0_HENB6|nr:hypothetical protein TBLA_0B08370 [Tetrapisispora blattae CBS 6284]CCH59652.1 hypothetical protein TBLA_0B08370 [Tetrapisispora blattae CBS 6284]
MSNSLKSLDKKISSKKNVYRPVLDNPYTNESNLFPRVNDQALIWNLLQVNVLNKCKLLANIDQSEWPFKIYSGFNNVIAQITELDSSSKAYLFVCNRDPGISKVLLQQLPLLCFQKNVTVVQLPKGSFSVMSEALGYLKANDYIAQYSDGLLLLFDTPQLNKSFVTKLDTNVEPLSFPWLNPVYKEAKVKLFKSSKS